MRDTIKNPEYFAHKLQSNQARILKFETLLTDIEPSNERGIRIGKSWLSRLHMDSVKLAYSAGAGIQDVYAHYLRFIDSYKDVCAPVDSTYDIIDVLSLGVLFRGTKFDFLPGLETIEGRFHSRDGLIGCLFQSLRDEPLTICPSQLDYFNRLAEGEDPAEILSLELSQWYRHHKDAYWYNAHRSKNDTYCGYWCFEIAALSQIFGVDDSGFAQNPYYPYDVAHN